MVQNKIFFTQKTDQLSDDKPTAIAEHGFGAAKQFMPLPNMVVGSYCTWQLRLNTVPARIPGGSMGKTILVQFYEGN